MRFPLVPLFLVGLLAPFADCWRSSAKEYENRAKIDAASATINHAAGVFKQVNKAGTPIYRHVSGSDWGMRQVSTAGGKALYRPSTFGNAVNRLGKVFWFGAVAMEIVNVAEAAGKDLQEGGITNTVHASSRAVGGYAGASYGAASGAAMLSFLPGVGTIVGGIAGGFIGAYTGAFAGEIVATATTVVFGI